jgi:hypothetical protein
MGGPKNRPRLPRARPSKHLRLFRLKRGSVVPARLDLNRKSGALRHAQNAVVGKR